MALRHYHIASQDAQFPFGTKADHYHVELRDSASNAMVQQKDHALTVVDGEFDMPPGSYVMTAIMADEMGALVGEMAISAPFVVPPEEGAPVSLPQPIQVTVS
jgi:hypothetical protein